MQLKIFQVKLPTDVMQASIEFQRQSMKIKNIATKTET